jgi:hypothetical protein
MLIVQVAFDARLAPHVVADTTKSAALVPLSAVEEMVIAVLSLLVTVTVLTALGEPIPWFPNARVAADNVI